MRLTWVLTLLLTIVLSSKPSLADEQMHQHSGDPQKLGKVRFPTSCDAAAQQQFNRALAMLHSFWYGEAEKQFRAVTESSPKCAIAYWGVAMTYWHPLWEPRGPDAAALREGFEAVQKAEAAKPGTAREQDYIAAVAAFYRDFDKVDYAERTLRYESAMERLRARYPDDPEATVFYALSLLGSATASPPDKTYARQKRAGELLTPIFGQQRSHPGVVHYIIHAYDFPPLAAEGLEAARQYARTAPDSPHALHMPSHIFTRLGSWQESVGSNLASAAAARKHDLTGDELHAEDYLVFAYLQMGQDDEAKKVMERAPQAGPAKGVARFAGLYATAAMPARYVVERRRWTEAASLPMPANLPGGRYAWADAAIYFARGLGAARSGKLQQARQEVQKLQSARETLTELKESYWANQVEIQRQAVSAWIALGEGKREQAVQLMRAAAELEAASDKHPVTPGAIVPARALLGDMLMELKRPVDAAAEYAVALKSEPNRFYALYGAARSAELAGDAKALGLYRKLLDICRAGDQQRPELRQAKAFVARQESQEAASAR
jgi:tetratricopeptide (TPR) repeat protein